MSLLKQLFLNNNSAPKVKIPVQSDPIQSPIQSDPESDPGFVNGLYQTGLNMSRINQQCSKNLLVFNNSKRSCDYFLKIVIIFCSHTGLR